MAKKYYAVKVGKVTGIYSTWDECKAQTDGVSGVIYKSFKNLSDAEAFMKASESEQDETMKSELTSEEWNEKIEIAIGNIAEGECIAFVDGSYKEDDNKVGYGAILFDASKEKNTLYKAFSGSYAPEFVELRNVAAELEAAKDSILLAVSKNAKKITIYHDYTGISEWAKGNWKTNKKLTKEYAEFIEEQKKKIDIDFVKVPAHIGVKYNEEADKLAKRSLLSRGHRTYKDGSVYFVHNTIKEWKEIFDLINEENKNLCDDFPNISYEKCEQGDRTKVTVRLKKDTVYITCYRFGSYVQGKHTSLYQKLVSTAVELLTNEETVIEVLDNYYAIDIPKDEVTRKFDRLVSNFNGDHTSKIYNNILTSVYNTMISTYMPDYTQLLTPVFRAYEFCLHRILGDTLGLGTENARGANNFAFFDRDAVGRYYLNNPSKAILTSDQLTLLEEIYNKYNAVRHKYSHWSYDEIDSAVVETIEDARELINEGLALINNYFELYR